MAVINDTYGPWLFRYWPNGLVLSPRMYDTNAADHFIDTNGLSASFSLSDLETTTETPATPKGPLTLVLTINGSTYKIPVSLAHYIGPGYNREVLWRYVPTGDSGSFKYYREGPPIP